MKMTTVTDYDVILFNNYMILFNDDVQNSHVLFNDYVCNSQFL